MKIIVMSDTHRSYAPVEKIIRLHGDADLFIHLGDGESEIERVLSGHPGLADRFRYVRGNCDHGSFAEKTAFIDADGHRILATHGHDYQVRFTLELLKQAADENNCDIVLFGHTHSRYNSYENGKYIMNPGSASCPRDGNWPSYGIIEIMGSNVLTNIADI